MNLKPLPLTVANLEVLQAWQKKLTEYIDEHGKKQIGKVISKMYAEDEAFKNLVDEAIASQGKFTQDQLNAWVQSNLVAASQLNMLMKTMPNTIQALVLGIQCMKETVDKTVLSPEELESFNGEEYWKHITLDAVQEYCATIIDLT